MHRRPQLVRYGERLPSECELCGLQKHEVTAPERHCG